MGKGKHIGICHICGQEGELTFEHIPPRKAFNDKPVLKATFEQMINNGLEPITHGDIQQKGAGGYTLCSRCNSRTGTWYGNAFINWCYQGLLLYQHSEGNLSFYCPYHIFPLRVIKQIISMMFSVNSERFQEVHPELVKFILNPEEMYLNPRYRLYTYFVKDLKGSRFAGITATGNFLSKKIILMSEVTYPPFGYVMTLDSEPPDNRLFDITYFANYSYNFWGTLYLKIPVLPILLFLPGDYRTEKRIREDYEANLRFRLNNDNI